MTDARWQAVGALVDPVRRALFDIVRRARHPMTREQAAEAGAISRSLAAFHLDKLVDAGLLRAHYDEGERPKGRGRPPKVYAPVDDAVIVAIPERRYELVGQILADAVAEDPDDVSAAARRGARERGRRTGAAIAAARRSPRRPLRARSDVSSRAVGDDLDLACRTLSDLGFEPEADQTEPDQTEPDQTEPDQTERDQTERDQTERDQTEPTIVLHNCPFHRLAVRQPELVCGLNQAFVAGLLAGLGTDHLSARLAPRSGHCCVEVYGPAPPPPGGTGRRRRTRN
jgi:predicted ArsR family transcriptional regulator